jgi:alpha-tubulin suppressor-like RCC1 family protein
LSYGYGGNGRLGHGTEADEKKPREIEALKGKGIQFVAAGGYHSAVVTGYTELPGKI